MTGGWEEKLAELERAYPDWAIQHVSEATWPWEARRLPFRLSPSGGYFWVNAPTPERLRDLLDGALQMEAQAVTEDAAQARLDALRVRAAAAGFRADLAPGALTVAAPPNDDGPGQSDEVTCQPWSDDGGRLWFFDGAGQPIVEADNVTDAVVHLGGALWRVRR